MHSRLAVYLPNEFYWTSHKSQSPLTASTDTELLFHEITEILTDIGGYHHRIVQILGQKVIFRGQANYCVI